MKKKQKKSKIYCISDLHLEFYDNYEQLYEKLEQIMPDADILILAGDIGYPADSRYPIAVDSKINNVGSCEDNLTNLLIRFKKRYQHVIMVMGKHEYYGIKNFDRHSAVSAMEEICAKTDVVLLNNNTVVINGVKFIGTTLWTNAEKHIKYMMADFGKVFKEVKDYNDEFFKCYRWLADCLMDDLGDHTVKRQVVITHHLPTSKLSHAKYDGNLANSGYYVDIIDNLLLDKVKYWFCGHTHQTTTLRHNGVHYVVNPSGYPSEQRATKTQSTVYHI